MHYKSYFPDPPKVPETNVHHLLFNRPDQKEWPDHTLFVDATTGYRRSFREFVERVRDGATALGTDIAQGGLGLRPENGDVIGILSENCLDYVTLVHSLLAITVPFVLFSSYSTPYEFKHTNSLAQPTRIFASPSLLPLALTSGLPLDRIYILEGQKEGYTSYDQLVLSVRKNGTPRLPVRHATKDTLAYMIFSSGTSGLPKAVMISHGNVTGVLLGLMVVGMEIVKVQPPQGLDSSEGIPISLSVVPLYHALGFYTTIVFAFLSPSTVFMLPKWDIEVFFDSIPKYKITNLTLVPSLIHQIVHHPRFQTTDLSLMKGVSSAAAYLPVQLSDQLRARLPGMDGITEGYGLSEFTTIAAIKALPGMLNGRAKVKPGSVGILFPGVEARIIRPDGSLAGPNEPGELLLRGGLVALGYKGNDKATRETFVDGWLRTGDQMRIDEDGALFFEDRTKDTLKVSGMQVSPIEIEDAILAHPEKLIVDVTVAGVSGGRTSDERIPRAWIVLSSTGATLGEKEVVARLDAWVRDRLSRYKWLRGGIEIVQVIPKSPTGKVLRRLLVEEYEKDVKARAKL